MSWFFKYFVTIYNYLVGLLSFSKSIYALANLVNSDRLTFILAYARLIEFKG